MRDFRKLEIWELGMDLISKTYKIVNQLPKIEKYSLISQMRRSAISIPSNIAEGCSRTSNKEMIYFLEIAIGSSFELETQLMATAKIGYIEENQLSEILDQIHLFQRKANSFRTRLKQ